MKRRWRPGAPARCRALGRRAAAASRRGRGRRAACAPACPRTAAPDRLLPRAALPAGATSPHPASTSRRSRRPRRPAAPRTPCWAWTAPPRRRRPRSEWPRRCCRAPAARPVAAPWRCRDPPARQPASQPALLNARPRCPAARRQMKAGAVAVAEPAPAPVAVPAPRQKTIEEQLFFNEELRCAAAVVLVVLLLLLLGLWAGGAAAVRWWWWCRGGQRAGGGGLCALAGGPRAGRCITGRANQPQPRLSPPRLTSPLPPAPAQVRARHRDVQRPRRHDGLPGGCAGGGRHRQGHHPADHHVPEALGPAGPHVGLLGARAAPEARRAAPRRGQRRAGQPGMAGLPAPRVRMRAPPAAPAAEEAAVGAVKQAGLG
jgi:hypothetical protein